MGKKATADVTMCSRLFVSYAFCLRVCMAYPSKTVAPPVFFYFQSDRCVGQCVCPGPPLQFQRKNVKLLRHGACAFDDGIFFFIFTDRLDSASLLPDR